MHMGRLAYTYNKYSLQSQWPYGPVTRVPFVPRVAPRMCVRVCASELGPSRTSRVPAFPH